MSQLKRRNKTGKAIFFRIALVALSLYFITMMMQLRAEKSLRDRQLAEIDLAIEHQMQIIAELEDSDYNKHLEEMARERGLSRPGEIIFQEFSGIE